MTISDAETHPEFLEHAARAFWADVWLRDHRPIAAGRGYRVGGWRDRGSAARGFAADGAGGEGWVVSRVWEFRSRL